MVITHSGSDSVTIKTKTEPIVIGPAVTIGSYAVPGAGEYDIASIQCDGKPLSNSVAYFIRTEDLTVTILTEIDAEVTKLDDASSTNVLVVDVRSNDTPESLKGIVKSLEPSYVVVLGAGATPAFVAGLGLPPFEEATLKLSRTGLPLEGTWVLARA